MARETGVDVKMIEGRRVTDDATLEIALMVYAGLINKQLVAELQAKGCPALGLSGADGDLIRSHKRPAAPVDFGWVGDVDHVRAELLGSLIAQGLCPVLCALTHDGKGQLLNTNADTIATEVAISLSSEFRVRLWYCFEKEGVLREVEDPRSLIPRLNRRLYNELREEGRIASGMIPKLDNAFRALEQGAESAGIGKAGYFAMSSSNFTQLQS
jgi:acetylglutamate kinase